MHYHFYQSFNTFDQFNFFVKDNNRKLWICLAIILIVVGTFGIYTFYNGKILNYILQYTRLKQDSLTTHLAKAALFSLLNGKTEENGLF